MDHEWLKTIKKSQLFNRIDEYELKQMLECLKPIMRTYKRNELMTVEGETFEGVGVILTGSAAVTKESAKGSRTIITILESGSMFGEMVAFSDKRVWPATVFAQGECRAIFLPPEKILGNCEKACVSHKMLILNMLSILSDKALMLNRKVEYLSIKSMRGKISRFFLEQCKSTGNLMFTMPMKRSEFADFLNVSRPSLSREMGRMKNEGIIDFYRSSVSIKDIDRLISFME